MGRVSIKVSPTNSELPRPHTIKTRQTSKTGPTEQQRLRAQLFKTPRTHITNAATQEQPEPKQPELPPEGLLKNQIRKFGPQTHFVDSKTGNLIKIEPKLVFRVTSKDNKNATFTLLPNNRHTPEKGAAHDVTVMTNEDNIPVVIAAPIRPNLIGKALTLNECAQYRDPLTGKICNLTSTALGHFTHENNQQRVVLYENIKSIQTVRFCPFSGERVPFIYEFEVNNGGSTIEPVKYLATREIYSGVSYPEHTTAYREESISRNDLDRERQAQLIKLSGLGLLAGLTITSAGLLNPTYSHKTRASLCIAGAIIMVGGIFGTCDGLQKLCRTPST